MISLSEHYNYPTIINANLIATYSSTQQVQDDQLVSELKISIGQKADGLSVGKQKLIYKGRTMQDSKPLSDYGLSDGCKIHLIVKKDDSEISPSDRFESILRDRLTRHFAPQVVEKIMANLRHEIESDINSSSLDDLERLAKQKLNISDN